MLPALKGYGPKAVPSGGRGEPIKVGIATRDRQQMQGGERSVALRWSGGSAPFHILIQTTITGEILCDQMIAGTSVRCASAKYEPGSYTVYIRDRWGAETSFSFESRKSTPGDCFDTAKLVQRSSDVRLATTASAIQVLSCGSEWRFEAYQILADLWAEYQPAEVVVEGIEGGYDVASDRK